MKTEAKQIIIPSAALVPEELQNLGKLPAVIYPINQKVTFDYLYDQYGKSGCTLHVICGVNAGKVHQRLKQYETYGNVFFRDLHDVRDLGYTVAFGLQNIEDPIIINFADTIVDETTLQSDSFYYSEDELSEKWTYFEEENGKITNLFDKIEPVQGGRKKLFVGVFQIMHTSFFRQCLENALKQKEGQVSTFYEALMRYSLTYPLTPVRTDKWFDIGHAEQYFASKLEVQAREFNHITVDRNRGILRKTSTNKEKFINEILWYLKLPSDIEYVRPRIFSYSTSYQSPFVEMEYYSYHTLHELYLNGELTRAQWHRIFEKILFILNDFSRYTVKDEGTKEACREMYLVKTQERLNQMRECHIFDNFFDKEITVNDSRYLSLNEIENKLQNCIPDMLCDAASFSIIHGDLCFSNIMIDSEFQFVKLIDPRGSFGRFDIYGDRRYEYAKILHSVDGKYDYIIKDLFSLKYDLSKPEISYRILEKQAEYSLLDLCLEVFHNMNEQWQEIELIESLLFLSMIPLHSESLEQQLVMLGTGLEIMDRAIDIKA